MKERRNNTNNENCDREGKEEGKGVHLDRVRAFGSS